MKKGGKRSQEKNRKRRQTPKGDLGAKGYDIEDSH